MARQTEASNNSAAVAPERASRIRQRQRLIDACISALHIHGPSRTTVEKVVALADLSPGIVRFYFDSKDAMLVASLAYLASEFEERVMAPVARLKDTPVKALEQLVELYLDPELASPRKVSVWYSFWGEASSRQEYLEICGKKDDAFATLVHELMERLIAQTGQAHLDADGVALGLMGVLEVLWQSFAFTDEAKIDRGAAKRRSFAFLGSVFPGQFGPTGGLPVGLGALPVSSGGFAAGPGGLAAGTGALPVGPGALPVGRGGFAGPGELPVGSAVEFEGRAGRHRVAVGVSREPADSGSPDGCLPAWAYSDSALLTLERDRLFRRSWQVVGHEADIPKVGDYLTADLAAERVLVVRSHERDIRAFRNSCRKRPHALVSGARGQLKKIACDIHGLVYDLDGKFRSGGIPGDLVSLELALPGRFILIRAAGAEGKGGVGAEAGLLEIAGAPTGDWESLPELQPLDVEEIPVAADWKLIVEQWLDAPPRPQGTQRTFLPPNQILERSPSGALLLQVIPQAAGRCVIRRLEYVVAGKSRNTRRAAGRPESRKVSQSEGWLQQDIEVAESTQAGLAAGIDEADSTGAVSPELAELRRSIRELLPRAR